MNQCAYENHRALIEWSLDPKTIVRMFPLSLSVSEYPSFRFAYR